MRHFLVFVLGVFPFCLHAQVLQDVVQAKIQIPALKGAWWGGFSSYADNQEETFSINADTRLAPASTLKLLTTAAALQLLGPHHRFETKLYASVLPDSSGTLNGDLILRGGGDMTLGSRRVHGAQTYAAVLKQWVNAIKQAGIKLVICTL